MICVLINPIVKTQRLQYWSYVRLRSNSSNSNSYFILLYYRYDNTGDPGEALYPFYRTKRSRRALLRSNLEEIWAGTAQLKNRAESWQIDSTLLQFFQACKNLLRLSSSSTLPLYYYSDRLSSWFLSATARGRHSTNLIWISAVVSMSSSCLSSSSTPHRTHGVISKLSLPSLLLSQSTGYSVAPARGKRTHFGFI